jgi:hypothetical protein
MAKRKTKAVGPVAFDDKKWREEDDARTLAEAAAIRSDKARMKGAKSGAQRMVDEQNAKLKGLKSVAKSKVK